MTQSIFNKMRWIKKIINLFYKYRGLNKLDKKIEKYINFNNGFFVELGANDGIQQSNTYYFEKFRGWTGVLVEPAPNNYLLCRKNRSSKTKVYCNACTSFSYKEKFVEIIYSDLMSVSLGLETDLNNPTEHARIGKKWLNNWDNNFVFGSLAKTLNEILISANAPKRIDFLSLDVEGCEIEVLKGINHSIFRFNYICVESRSKENLFYFLKNNGYSLLEQLSEKDYLFKDISLL